jgi:hypothetical protein
LSELRESLRSIVIDFPPKKIPAKAGLRDGTSESNKKAPGLAGRG